MSGKGSGSGGGSGNNREQPHSWRNSQRAADIAKVVEKGLERIEKELKDK